MKTKEEILKALDVCGVCKCSTSCAYFDVDGCLAALHKDAGNLIFRLSLANFGERFEKGAEPLNEWAEQIHATAVRHGWWDMDRSFGEVIALCHSELSEALEVYRDNLPLYWTDVDGKPEGIAVEMIDCMIRILDWCSKEGIDVDEILAAKTEYNKGRPYRHGGKKL